ncbi:MAG: hypothetical protein EAZ91_00655 [Cytophagales bacterium]|nr:MAG: hypothetical protein EAZ91_00655 [Cytophagales bacterium]
MHSATTPLFEQIVSAIEPHLGTFLLGAVWASFLLLVCYSAFYRPDKVFQWATLAMGGFVGQWTLTWITKLIDSQPLPVWVNILFIVCETCLGIGYLGVLYSWLRSTKTLRFKQICSITGVAFGFGILACLYQSIALLSVFKLGVLVVLVDMAYVNYIGYKQKIKLSLLILGCMSVLIVVQGYLNYKYITIDLFAVSLPISPFVASIINLLVLVVFIGHLAIYNQITRRRLAKRERQLIQLEREKRLILEEQNELLSLQVTQRTTELVRSNMAKVKLFSIISHDLRSPLVSLRDSLNLVHQKNLSQNDFSDLVQRITQHIHRLSSSLDNLLQWSMSQLNEIRSRPAPLEMRETIDDILELAHEATRQKQLRVTNLVPVELMAFADEYQVQTILRNLIDNAIKFTPEYGHIQILSESCQKWATLSVTDNGAGIPPQQLATLFGDLTSRRGTKGERGMGLGLNLCMDLAKRNGGTLTVDSTPGVGTRVRLTLPLALDLVEQAA